MKTLMLSALAASLLLAGWADADPTTAPTTAPAGLSAQREGQRAFDWEIGEWDTRLRRLRAPLSGKTEWLDYAGTTVVSPLGDQRANIVELDVSGAAGRIAGVSLRLFQPATQQWTLHFANLANGLMTNPMSGGFQDGRGVFYGDDILDGRAIKVRFLITQISPTSWRFEQAYSGDAGQTWEVNWVAVDTRRDQISSGALPRQSNRARQGGSEALAQICVGQRPSKTDLSAQFCRNVLSAPAP